MGRYNQNNPTVLGMEFPPLATEPVLLDTASEFGHTFRSLSDVGTVNLARVMATMPPPGQALRKCLVMSMHNSFQAPSTGVMRKIIIPVLNGSLHTGAALGGGAGSLVGGLSNPSDTQYVSLTGANAYMRVTLDLAAARVSRELQFARIVDVTLRYAVSGPFDTQPGAFYVSLERPGSALVFDMDTTLTGPTNHYDNVIPRRSRFGDLNPFWNSTLSPFADWTRMPWHYATGSNNHRGLIDLTGTQSTVENLRFSTTNTASGEFRLHYCALEVTYCNEDREGMGGLEITPGAGLIDAAFCYDVPMGSAYSYGFGMSISTGTDYLLTVGQGYCGALSVTYPVPVGLDRISAADEIYGPHEGAIIRKTLREGETWTRERVAAIPAIALYTSQTVKDSTTIVHASQTYIVPVVSAVDAGTFSGDTMGRILDNAAGTYPQIRFYARASPATQGELRVAQTDAGGFTFPGPEAGLSVEQWAALPEIVDGWREVTLDLEVPVVTAGLGGILYFTFSSTAPQGAPWQILGADANPNHDAPTGLGVPTYGGGLDVYFTINGTDDFTADMTIMIIQEMPEVTGFAAAPAVQPLDLVDEHCGIPVGQIPTGIHYVSLSWDPNNEVAVAGFAYYEVQRRDTTMDAGVWETVATVSNVANADFDDYEARVGVESSYRIRFVHVDGYVGAWATTITITVPAPGVTGGDVGNSVLILTTNHDPNANLAYMMVFDALPAQEFGFPEGGQTVLQPMYGRDYRVAFRPLERDGTEFTRTLMLNAAGVPPETLSAGFTSLRDLAWDTVPYVCVRDELHNRWLTAVSVPSGNVRDVPAHGHLVLAQAAFAEVTGTPAPVDYADPCEGAVLEDGDNFAYWSMETIPAALNGVRVLTDTFTRTLADQWGNTDTGQAWTITAGAATEFDVTPAGGTIANTVAGSPRQANVAGTWDNYRAHMEVTAPVLATVGRYAVGMVVREIDAAPAVVDTFTRTVANGWGTSDSGHVWARLNDPAAAASDYNVTGGQGRIVPAASGVRRVALNGISRRALEIYVDYIAVSAAVTGSDSVQVEFSMGVGAGGDTRHQLVLFFGVPNTSCTVLQVINSDLKVIDGTFPGVGTSTQIYSARLQGFGSTLRAKVWVRGGAEPGTWTTSVVLPEPIPDGTVMVSMVRGAGVSNPATLYGIVDGLSFNVAGGPDHYRHEIRFETTGVINLVAVARTIGIETDLETHVVDGGSYVPGTKVMLDVRNSGTSMDARAWKSTQPRPNWNDGPTTGREADFWVPVGGRVGIRSVRSATNTNANPIILVDNFTIDQLNNIIDIRALFRPFNDTFEFAIQVDSYSSSEPAGGYYINIGDDGVAMTVEDGYFVRMTTDRVAQLKMFKNRLTWIRAVFTPDDGWGHSTTQYYALNDDGVTWDLVDTIIAATAEPTPPIASGSDFELLLAYPGGVWVHRFEVRLDGVLVASPDWTGQPPGTKEITDAQGNTFVDLDPTSGGLCADG